ncbi:hypothetical protein K435DRAFT_862448 [Dendrothele bispora CBS 962.96]|uniref:Peptide hydrolase n=1 Tax=Dendrothele bispora (strain CBS 962.96) TaxID=1314807 RepID=A0A4S8LU22_DENBC|nr:hypothetical protein K435DRAFT_862448 [Dendrothele bispora CBS 962.96]
MGRTTSAFVVLLYLAVFLSVFISDQLPSVPSEDVQHREFGLNLTEAYADLQHVARMPHPYMSHANDQVRKYILGRVLEIQGKASTRENGVEVKVSDDLFTNGSWGANPLTMTGSGIGTYFEGTNILVKILGSSEAQEGEGQGAVLFSAHYDSVSTAPGATDDAMGVITLLQLLSYFSSNPPLRTVIFNINNGEEDGLNGAKAFLLHPWISNSNSTQTQPQPQVPSSEIPTTFLNLEGAASGGRPLLFRATGGNVLRSFARGRVSHPHANVLSSDAFKRGFIRSGTDYSVYNQPCAVPNSNSENPGPGCRPMEGIDIAFYRGRSKYHTKYDSVAYTDGRERALWAMMEMAWGSGRALVNGDRDGFDGTGGVGRDQNSVYFDLFGVSFLIFPLSYLLTFNITALVAGPIILILLLLSESALVRSRRARKPQTVIIVEEESSSSSSSESPGSEQEAETDTTRTEAATTRASKWRSKVPRMSTVWLHLQFWVALVVTVGVQVAIVFGYLKINPFFTYTYPFLVLLSCFSFSVLTFTSVLSISTLFHPSSSFSSSSSSLSYPSPQTQTQTIFLHLYIFTYVLLILSTVGITRLSLGSSYFVSVWNLVLWIGCVGNAIGGCVFGGLGRGDESVEVVVRSTSRDRDRDREGDVQTSTSTHEHEDADERTPLIRHRSVGSQSLSSSSPSSNNKSTLLHDILLVLPSLLLSIVLIPVPLIVLTHVAAILLGALPQTLADGSEPGVVYGAISLLGVGGAMVGVPLMVRVREEETVVGSRQQRGSSGGGKMSKRGDKTGTGSGTGFGFGFGAKVVTLITLFGTGILLAAWIPWPNEWLPASSSSSSMRRTRAQGWEGWKGGVFPFDEGSPLKQWVYYQQEEEKKKTGKAKVTTTLTGTSPFLEQMILPGLPSYRGDGAYEEKRRCVGLGGQEVKRGLKQCSWVVWEGDLERGTPSRDGDRDRDQERWEMIPDPGVMSEDTVQLGHEEEEDEDDEDKDVDLSARSWDWEIPTNKWIRARARRTSFNVTSYSEASSVNDTKAGAQFRIRGQNTRACRVYFDSPVEGFRVLPIPSSSSSSEPASPAFAPGNGRDELNGNWTAVNTTEVRLWSRTWDREFVVDVIWDNAKDQDMKDSRWSGWQGYQGAFGVASSDHESNEDGHEGTVEGEQNKSSPTRSGRVACEWSEYESGMVGLGLDVNGTVPSCSILIGIGSTGGKIPAYEEVLTFLPRWAVASKLTDGLVEVESAFVL